MTPTVFSQRVFEVLTHLGVDVQVRDKSWAEQKKMGSFLSVARGSIEPPKFLEISYKGAENPSEPPVTFVGKGVTFDAGGISLKVSRSLSPFSKTSKKKVRVLKDERLLIAAIGDGRDARRYERRRLRGCYYPSRGRTQIEEKYRWTDPAHGESAIWACYEAGRSGAGDERQDHHCGQH